MQILRCLTKKRVYKTLFFVLITALFIVPTFFAAVRANDVRDQATYQQEVKLGEEQAGNLQMTVSATGTFLLNFALNQLAGCYGTPAECQDSRFLSDAGAVGGAANLVAMTYSNPPANTATYVADVMQNMGIAQPAYAQGLGFSSLQPILGLWKVMRNIAYVFFVIIFLVIGFAIMFRQNLGSQTAVTVQQALPKIVVALLAVTFSYAIAGFLIDLMYVLMFFLVAIFQASGLVNKDFVSIPINGAGSENSILSQSIFEIGRSIISNGFAVSAGTNIGEMVKNALGGEGIGFVAGVLSSVLLTVILFVAIIIAIVKTFLALLKVYLNIVMSIVFAPIILMMSAINSGAFVNWLKGLVADLLVFPALLLFILIGFMFMGLQGSDNIGEQFSSGGFLPPFIPGRGSAQQISLLMGVAAIMLMSEVPNIVGKFKPKSIFDELGGIAFGNAMAGAPIGGAATLGLGGAALGGGIGAIRGLRASAGVTDGRQILTNMRDFAIRGSRNMAGRGARYGSQGASALGAKTPGFARLAETAVLDGFNYFTDQNILKRISEGRAGLSAVGIGVDKTQELEQWETQRQIAEQRAALKREELKRLQLETTAIQKGNLPYIGGESKSK